MPITEAVPASLQWNWRYQGAGITAGGTLTTDDVANSVGCFQITAITGSRNGVAITALQPVGTAIPGNEPYAVDNLVCRRGPRLTGNGFGFALADGTFGNPFYAHTQTPPTYLEFLSIPHRTHTELPIRFTVQMLRSAKAATSGATHMRR